jgi:hypothetical protein
LDQDYSVAGLSDVGRRDKVDVVDSWNSGAADREVYVTSTEHDWIHAQDERTGLPPEDIPRAMDSDNREFVLLALHLCDRARKHQHQGKAKKEFADDFCVHVIYFPFVVLAFFDFSSLRTHFWPFTGVLQEIRRDITRKDSEIGLKSLVSPPPLRLRRAKKASKRRTWIKAEKLSLGHSLPLQRYFSATSSRVGCCFGFDAGDTLLIPAGAFDCGPVVDFTASSTELYQGRVVRRYRGPPS